eukprot:CAMPEP_0204568608 /NCGR_PEP_ID=MMETSP0661-20131031/37281_1 /ASSEMBLY_ACC=CAM_ASM_000606 /TAXON_ID=109239 /ORGANISM="Alexandrium margalefi, Strain AMGDE01CS-322" /LENGTH=705 /DNA_ID=CAMNT_0051576649 /DNA_START=110 /DNA_END=2227 /DNA_ORIENTATION=+
MCVPAVPAYADFLVEHARVDFWSESFKLWLPSSVKDVDVETGQVTITGRAEPLSREDSLKLLRPRTWPSRKHLAWIAEVMRDGRVEFEAHRLFHKHSEWREGRSVLTHSGLYAVGEHIDKRIGVCGCTYELIMRAAKEYGRRATLRKEDCWVTERSAEGFKYFSDGQTSQWLPPTTSLELSAEAFAAVFWEILDSVHRLLGEALCTKDSRLGTKDEFQREYLLDMNKKLGGGESETSYLAEEHRSGILREVKKIPIPLNPDPRAPPQLLREIESLRALDHPNIVRLCGCYKFDWSFWLVMDHCSGTDLEGYVKHFKSQNRYIHERDVARILRQLLRAVAHVHARGLLHLNINPASVAVVRETHTLPPGRGRDPSGPAACWDECAPLHVMLIDFCWSSIFQPGDFQRTTCWGRQATRAPEALKDIGTPAADVFSCGCIFFFLLARRLPFDMKLERADQFWTKRPQHVEYTAKDFYSRAAYELCDSMLLYDRLSRPTVAECLQDTFFEPINRERRDGKVDERLKQLVKVRERSLLYRRVALAVASKWPAHRMPSIRKAFLEIDVAGTGGGFLLMAQIERTLVRYKIKPDVAAEAAKAMDFNKDGLVDWTEFVAACVQLECSSLDADLRYLFEEADRDKDGFLNKQEFASLAGIDHEDDEAMEDAMQDFQGELTPDGRLGWKSFRIYFSSDSSKRRPKSYKKRVRFDS